MLAYTVQMGATGPIDVSSGFDCSLPANMCSNFCRSSSGKIYNHDPCAGNPVVFVAGFDGSAEASFGTLAQTAGVPTPSVGLASGFAGTSGSAGAATASVGQAVRFLLP
jgi:hypothetical protein